MPPIPAKKFIPSPPYNCFLNCSNSINSKSVALDMAFFYYLPPTLLEIPLPILSISEPFFFRYTFWATPSPTLSNKDFFYFLPILDEDKLPYAKGSSKLSSRFLFGFGFGFSSFSLITMLAFDRLRELSLCHEFSYSFSFCFYRASSFSESSNLASSLWYFT